MNYGDGGLSASDVALLNRSGDNDGFGGSGFGAWWIIIFLIFAFGGWGNNRAFGYGGGYGGEGGGTNTSVYEGYVLNNDFSQLSRQISDGFNSQERKLDGINNGLCTLGYQELQNINGVNTNIFNATSGIQNTLTQGFAGLNTGMVQQGYENRIAVNGVGTQLANCCCDLRQQISDTSCVTQRAIDSVNFNNAQNTCAITNTINMGLKDVMQNCNNNYRMLHDEIVANKLEAKNDQIALLQTKLNNAELRASQEAQSNYIISTIRPCPIPAYASCNPWGCNCGNNGGCGC